MRTGVGHVLDLSLRTEETLRKSYCGGSWEADEQLACVASAPRRPPHTPASFVRDVLSRCTDPVPAGDGGAMRALLLEAHTHALQKITAKCAHLDYSQQCWGAAEVRTLGETLPSLLALTSLDLSRNALDVEAASVLGGALELPAMTRTTALSSLDVSHNDEIGSDGARALAHGIASLPLRRLDVSGCFIRDEGAAALAAALGAPGAACTQLETLIVATNSLRGAGAAALLGLLASRRSLTSLSLRDNLLKDEGCVAIQRVVVEAGGSFGGLRSLDLSHNGISPKGALMLEEVGGGLGSKLVLGTLIKRGAGVSGSGKLAP